MKTDLLAPRSMTVVGFCQNLVGDPQYSLSGMNSAELPDAALVFVASVQDYFQLDKSSTSEPDGITVVAAAVGSGNWHRSGAGVLLVNNPWLAQTEWYIDADDGDDENGGGSAEDALQSWAEFERRMGNMPEFSEPVHVYLLTSLDETPRLRYRLVNDGSYLHVKGSPQSILESGTVTAFTAPNVEVEGQISDSSGDLAAVGGRRLRITNSGLAEDPKTFIGPASGGPSTVRCGQPTYFSELWSDVTAYDPSGKDYQIEEQCSVDGCDFHVERVNESGGSSHSNIGLILDDLDLSGSGGDPLCVVRNSGLNARAVLNACALGASGTLSGKGDVRFVSCATRSGSGSAGSMAVWGIQLLIDYHSGGGLHVRSGSTANLNQVNQFDESQLTFQENTWSQILRAGVYDVESGSGVLVLGPSTSLVSLFLWGSGNSAYGLDCGGVVYYGMKPTIAGAIAEANIGGTQKDWDDVPFINPSNLARIVQSP